MDQALKDLAMVKPMSGSIKEIDQMAKDSTFIQMETIIKETSPII